MQPASRRFFLQSLVGASVGYCFLGSVPIIGTGSSAVETFDVLYVGRVVETGALIDTRMFADALAEVYSRDNIFAPFEKSLTRFYQAD